MIPQIMFDPSKLKLIDPKTLKKDPNNRNKHSDEQIERFCKLLQTYGMRWPILVSERTGIIKAGEGRLLAALKLGMPQVLVSYQEFESDAVEYGFGISDNSIALWAELDLASIQTDLKGFPDMDVDLLGIEDFELIDETHFEPQCDEDEVPENVEPRTKIGDVYRLGNHRLLCGDSTSIDAIDRLMNGEKADLISTDPPYGMSLDTDRRDMGNTTTVYKPVIGDSEPFDPQHIIGAFPETPMILWGADYYCQRIPNWSDGSPLIWAKAHSEEENKVWGSSFETAWVFPKKKRLLWFIRRIHMGSEHEGTHPTQKPTEITTRAIEELFNIPKNGIVVDLFGGSGSTLIACEKTNRKCFMMELDPHYCDVIVARWEKYTGKKSELLNG